MLLKIDYILTLSISFIIPVIILISRVMGRRIKQVSTIVQDKLGNITSIINETVLGMDVIKGFILGKHAVGILKHENDIVKDKSVQASKVKAVTSLMNGLLNSLYLLLIIGLGAYRVAVPQETFLFCMSIRDNIACGKPDANDEEKLLLQNWLMHMILY